MSKLLDLWSDMTGVVLDYALSTPPSPAWMMCFGQVLVDGDAATANLRAKLIADGFPHGQDGSGNPLLPDVRGRTVAGKDDMGGTAAGRLTAAGAGIDGAALGAAGGSETHTLASGEMPTHNHGVNDPGHGHGVSDPGHGHSAYQDDHTHSTTGLALGRAASPYGLANPGAGYTDRIPTYPSSSTTNTPVSSGASAGGVYVNGAYSGVTVNGAATGISTQNNGLSEAHNNTQPTLVLNKIIKL